MILINSPALPGVFLFLRSHFKEDYQREGKCNCQNHQQLPGEVESFFSHDVGGRFMQQQTRITPAVTIPNDAPTSTKPISKSVI